MSRKLNTLAAIVIGLFFTISAVSDKPLDAPAGNAPVSLMNPAPAHVRVTKAQKEAQEILLMKYLQNEPWRMESVSLDDETGNIVVRLHSNKGPQTLRVTRGHRHYSDFAGMLLSERGDPVEFVFSDTGYAEKQNSLEEASNPANYLRPVYNRRRADE